MSTAELITTTVVLARLTFDVLTWWLDHRDHHQPHRGDHRDDDSA
jgi:hypothetical protein